MEDVGVIDTADLPRFAKSGIVAVVRPTQADADKLAQWPKILGAQRRQLALPWASLVAAGARLAFASDWTGFKVPMNPAVLISKAVNRPGPQRLTLTQALRAYTAGGAYASGEEKIKGRLAVGQLADIAVLDRDPFTVPAKELDKLNVVMTILDGKIVHRKESGWIAYLAGCSVGRDTRGGGVSKSCEYSVFEER
ncbi:MAG: amidohydrolase family protein [Acidobacteria bacterium]|nr:amidohydrolase family protein [Acidobacteriota bacterium]